MSQFRAYSRFMRRIWLRVRNSIAPAIKANGAIVANSVKIITSTMASIMTANNLDSKAVYHAS